MGRQKWERLPVYREHLLPLISASGCIRDTVLFSCENTKVGRQGSERQLRCPCKVLFFHWLFEEDGAFISISLIPWPFLHLFFLCKKVTFFIFIGSHMSLSHMHVFSDAKTDHREPSHFLYIPGVCLEFSCVEWDRACGRKVSWVLLSDKGSYLYQFLHVQRGVVCIEKLSSVLCTHWASHLYKFSGTLWGEVTSRTKFSCVLYSDRVSSLLEATGVE